MKKFEQFRTFLCVFIFVQKLPEQWAGDLEKIHKICRLTAVSSLGCLVEEDGQIYDKIITVAKFCICMGIVNAPLGILLDLFSHEKKWIKSAKEFQGYHRIHCKTVGI